jgi:sugar fermentation stimulation protein A
MEGIQNGIVKELAGYSDIKPEAKIGKSRIDILLSNAGEDPCYVEVKNVTLINDSGGAIFPDAVTTRGQKHLEELIQLKGQGIRAAMLYVINREDADSFAPASDIDPRYAELLIEAQKSGVEILAYQCKLSPEKIELSRALPVKL